MKPRKVKPALRLFEVCSIGLVFLGAVKLRGYGERRFMIAMFVFFQNQERSY